jgi:glutaredoxin 3
MFTSFFQVVVFSKSYCPFCARTKDLFTELDVDFKVYELDQMGDDGPALQMALLVRVSGIYNTFVCRFFFTLS